MQVTWEPEDIKPGRRYSKPGIIEVWMIGYLAPGGEHRYVSVSMADGMVTPPVSASAMASDLTSAGYLPLELIQA